MRAGYSPSQTLGGLAGSQRFSPAVSWPYGIPLNVSTPASIYPRTLPYCVFAIADLGVEQLPGAWCAAVLVLSDPMAGRPSAAPIPAVAGRISARRRFIIVGFPEFVLDIASPFRAHWLRSEEHTSELQSLRHLVCRLLL